MITILGLDLSLSSTGVAVVREGRLIYRTHVPTEATDTFLERARLVLREIDKCLKEYEPNTVYIENYSFDAKFGREVLGELHGVVMYFLGQRGVTFSKVSPVQIKQFATGKGRAPAVPEGVAKSSWGKRWIVEAVNTRYNMDFRLSENDEVDAFLVSLLGYYVERVKLMKVGEYVLLPDIPAFQTEVINAVLNPKPKVKRKRGGSKNGGSKEGTSRTKGSRKKQSI